MASVVYPVDGGLISVVVEGCSGMVELVLVVTGEPFSGGTSKLARTAPFLGSPVGGVVCIGKRVVGGSEERSRRWFRAPLACGAGLLFRDLDAIARFRASMLARRLLSSVLTARIRAALEALPPLGV